MGRMQSGRRDGTVEGSQECYFWCCVDEKSHRQQRERAQRPEGGQELGMLGEERKSSGELDLAGT